MAVLRKKAKHSGLKRLAIGATVVSAFVVGAIAGVKKDKVKAFAKKATRSGKAKLRRLGSSALNKVADAQDRVLG